MKKWLCLVLAVLMVLSMSTSVLAYETELLSELSESECLAFLRSRGVIVPDNGERDEYWGDLAKRTISMVEQNPKIEFGYSFTTLLDFSKEIKTAVNEYYGRPEAQVNANPRSLGSAQYSVLVEYPENMTQFNCYGYALGINEWLMPGYTIGVTWNSDYTVSQTADLVIQDRDQYYSCIGKTTTRPSYSDLPDSSEAICVRTGADDFHFMRLDQDECWYHKPGDRAIMRYEYLPNNDLIWNNEGYTYAGFHHPNQFYTSEIYYIIMGYMHYEDSAGYRYIGVQNGVQKHVRYCVLCNENYVGIACTFGANNRCTVCGALKNSAVINGTTSPDFTLQ